MDAVAIDAGGSVHVTGRELLPVDAGLVEFQLVNALPGAEAAHVAGVAVAFAAQLGDVRMLWLAYEAFGLAHGDVGFDCGAITAIAIGTAQTGGSVDVVLDEKCRFLDGTLHGRVALGTGVIRGMCGLRCCHFWGLRPGSSRKGDQQQCKASYL